MNEIILESIASLLGISGNDVFDPDLLVFINTAIAELTQIGVGPPEGFTAEEDSEWIEYLGTEDPLLNQVRTYIYLKVRLLFDTPSSHVTNALNQQLDETRFRIYSHVEPTFKGE